MVIGPSLGVVARATWDSPEELKSRSMEHQTFMMEVMNIQRQGGRKYYHEFPEGASSMSTKEARAVKGSEGNREVKVGEWRIKEKSMGGGLAVTNVEEVAEEVERAKLEETGGRK